MKKKLVSFTEPQAEWLEKQSREQYMNVSELVRSILRKEMEKEKKIDRLMKDERT